MVAKTPAPVVLTGRTVRLEPLVPAHEPALLEEGGGDAELWRWMPARTPSTAAELAAVAASVRATADVAFAVVSRETGRAVGWTCFLESVPEDERLEIGWTWYGRRHWRTAVNTECKLLLLTHAFEDLGMGRVQLKTDHRNERSQQAIARLGARREGALRRHRRRPDGTCRDTVYFSLLAEEWPEARGRLEAWARSAGPAAPGS